MKNLTVISSLFIAVLLAVSFASALTSDLTVSVKGVDSVNNQTIAIDAGDSLSIKAIFTADENASDVRVKAFIAGYRNEISDVTERFDIISNGVYTKFLTLSVPTDIDLSEDSTLFVRLESKTERVERAFNLRLQRISYNLEVLSIETDKKAVAGETLPVSVVVKNRGRNKLEDIYVIARIPQLGVEQKIYVGDLRTEDSGDDREDAVEAKVILRIPSDAKSGVYAIEAEVYNAEARVGAKRNIAVESAGFEQIISGATTRSIKAGETAEFDVVIVNPENQIGVYEVVPDSISSLGIRVTESVVTVPAQGSKVVKVVVTGKDAGSFVFGVNVEKNSEIVKRIQFTTIVESGSAGNSIAVLTVVLVIVFVVLLVILVVLLTRKPQLDELKESYY